jgi:hypothetical protein
MIKSGIQLIKDFEKEPQYHQKYMILKEKLILIFDSEGEKEIAVYKIPLTDSVLDSKLKENVYSIQYEDKSFYIKSKSEKEKNEWTKEISRQIFKHTIKKFNFTDSEFENNEVTQTDKDFLKTVLKDSSSSFERVSSFKNTNSKMKICSSKQQYLPNVNHFKDQIAVKTNIITNHSFEKMVYLHMPFIKASEFNEMIKYEVVKELPVKKGDDFPDFVMNEYLKLSNLKTTKRSLLQFHFEYDKSNNTFYKYIKPCNFLYKTKISWITCI